MAIPLRSQTMSETRGQTARRRRMTLRVSRDIVASEARVSVKTVKSYEDDAHEKPLSGQAIEDALDRLEAGAGAPPRVGRRASDSANRQIIDAVVGTGEGQLQIRVLSDGTRAIFIVPEGSTPPSDEEIQQVLKDVRGE